jgi:hypothetical protein
MKELLKALSKFQSEIKPIIKDATNPFFKAKYASLDHIQEHIKPTLISCNLVVIQRNVETEKGLFVESKVVHVDSGETETSIFPIIVSKQDAQSYGSAVSYAKRYSLSGLLNLTIQDLDDDGNVASEKINKETKPETKITEWLTKEQFDKAITSDAKGISATLTKYGVVPFGMSKDYRTQLNNKLTELNK